MTLTVRNVVVNGLYYALTVGALPSVALWVEAHWRGPCESSGFLRSVGVLAGLAGVLLQVWSIVLLQSRGRGTPSPVIPPETFVSEGPYAWLRNPINLGELLVFLGLAGWFGSWGLLFYSALAWISFQVFIIKWEEPRHRARYGDEYVKYCARVSRWFPGPSRVP